MNRIKRFFDKLSWSDFQAEITASECSYESNDGFCDESGYEFDIDDDYFDFIDGANGPTRDEFLVKIQNIKKAKELERQLESTDIDYLVKEEPKGTMLFLFPLEHYFEVLDILNIDKEQIIIIKRQ